MNRCLLVVGGSGTLGGPLCVQAERHGWQVVATYFTHPDRIRAGMPVQLDLRDLNALRTLVQTFRPEAIIHAAVTERSGPGFDDAIRVGAQHIAQAAAEDRIRLITLSTDLVFDGSEPLYTEETPPHPAVNSAYGHAKADAERDTLAIYPAALVARTSLIYDFDRANAQVEWMVRTIESGGTVTLYADQVRCPIWAYNLAEALLELVNLPAAGLLHVVGPGPVSRYALGTALLETLGFDPAQHVVPAPAPDTLPKTLHLSIERARALLKRTPLLTLEQAKAAR